MSKEWIINNPDGDTVLQLRKAGYSSVLSRLLVNRGITDPQAAELFFDTESSAFNDAAALKDIDKAASRIKKAVKSNEKIVIYGDYDVDGVTATTLLYTYLLAQGADVSYYIPDRESEGYGLNSDAVKKIAEDGAKLVVTVDTGISAFDEAVLAQKLGLDLIITDHHEPRGDIPHAYAVVNPKQNDCDYPYKELAGVGVAFKLICGLSSRTSANKLFEIYGGLVCLGTVADVVPLTGENRLIVSRGLEQLAKHQDLGLAALLEVAGAKDKKITAGLLSFTVAPRLNASGRLNSAVDSLKLLTAQTETEAKELAALLNASNIERQAIEGRILEQAVEIINKSDITDKAIIMVTGEGWHNGVIGIVASRLVELYGRPAIVVSFEGGEGRASCRSVPGLNIHEALKSCEEYLIRYGGHELAAGFSIKREVIDEFYNALNIYADNLPERARLKLRLECRLKPSELTLNTAREIKRIEPCGSGNPQPVFYVQGAQIAGITPLGGGNHLRLQLCADGYEFQAMAFGVNKSGIDCRIGEIVDLALNLDVNIYKNMESLTAAVRDMRKSVAFDEYAALYRMFLVGGPAYQYYSSFNPSRDEFAAVYKQLLSLDGQKADLEEICKTVCKKLKAFNYFKLLLILDVFSEMKLLSYTAEENFIDFEINKDVKINLKQSLILRKLTSSKE